MKSNYTQPATQVREWRGRNSKTHTTIAVFRIEDLAKPGPQSELDRWFGPKDAVKRGREYRKS